MYINEHMLAIMLAVFKNYGKEVKDIDVSLAEDGVWSNYQNLRDEFNLEMVNYQLVLKENGGNKRSKTVQASINRLIHLSGFIIPNDKEIMELFDMIRLMCKRCVHIYAKGMNFDYEEIAIIVFERIMKYRAKFDLAKTSRISGTRVNAFAYMTQVVKNAIYEELAKIQKEQRLLESIKSNYESNEGEITYGTDAGEMMELLFESVDRSDDEDIIRLVSEAATTECNIQSLIELVSRNGDYTPNEVIRVIFDYDLNGHLEDKMLLNRWSF